MITVTGRDGFTGHEQLDNVGAIHMNGRVYDPQLGRFMSADPLYVGDLADPQSLNPYSYIENNPLSGVDPSGFASIGLGCQGGNDSTYVCNQTQGPNTDGPTYGVGYFPSTPQHAIAFFQAKCRGADVGCVVSHYQGTQFGNTNPCDFGYSATCSDRPYLDSKQWYANPYYNNNGRVCGSLCGPPPATGGAGFSLHAGVAAGADERKKVERLCRYITRPPVATGRLSLTSQGQVRYKPKTPYRDGTTQVVFEPLVTGGFLLRLFVLLLGAAAAALASPGSAAAAANHPVQAEAALGHDAPEIMESVIDLAAATLGAGDTDGADALLQRASALLDRHPDSGGTLRLRVLILQSDRLTRLGHLADSNQVLYKALKLARSSESIGPLSQANVLDRLAANEARRGQVTSGNTYTSDALKLREKHYGKDSPEFASALLKSADWYRYTGEFGREVAQEKKALAVLERHFGTRDSRLGIVLIRLATVRIAQHTHRDDAESVMQRAINLEFGSGTADAYIKAEVLATSADLEVVFGKPEDSTPLYVKAWQVIANHEQLGPPAANQYFGRVRQLFLSTPDNIANIGTVDLGYAVTAIGTIDAVRILENAVPAMNGADITVKSDVAGAMVRAMRRSRYRPRIVDGAPVATTGLSFAAEFCLDLSEIVPICKARADVSATH